MNETLKNLLAQTIPFLKPIEFGSSFSFHMSPSTGPTWGLSTLDPETCSDEPDQCICSGSGASPEEAFEAWKAQVEGEVAQWVARYSKFWGETG